jgi:hypothetical protein
VGSDHRCDELAEDLAQCRHELALARRQHEEAAEALARSEQQRRQLRKRARALAASVDEHLAATARTARLTARVRGLMSRPDPEAEQVELIRSSGLFDPVWYVLEHPAVVASSLDPALHYLRHGVEDSLDPSPTFSTRQFLRDHPDVAASGQNPLVAHLLRDGRPADQPSRDA